MQKIETENNETRKFIFFELNQSAEKANDVINNIWVDQWSFQQAANLTNIIESPVKFMNIYFAEFSDEEISKFKDYYLLKLCHEIRVELTSDNPPGDAFTKISGLGQNTHQEKNRFLSSFGDSKRFFGYGSLT